MSDDELLESCEEIVVACREYSPGYRNPAAKRVIRPLMTKVRATLEQRDWLSGYAGGKFRELDSAVTAAFERQNGGPRHLDRRQEVIRAAMELKSGIRLVMNQTLQRRD